MATAGGTGHRCTKAPARCVPTMPAYASQAEMVGCARSPSCAVPTRAAAPSCCSPTTSKALSGLLRRYSRRWLTEKSIAEQPAFFHLNRLSSSMVIKIDFDLTMTDLARNLYQLLAL